jgi:hypothetical protein
MNASASHHEARHASAALLLELDPFYAGLEAPPPGFEPGGRVTVPNTAASRDPRSSALVGILGYPEGDSWPPAWPKKDGDTPDERDLARAVSALSLDGRGYRDLCDEARGLAARAEFKRVAAAIAPRLERGEVLDRAALKAIHQNEREKE